MLKFIATIVTQGENKLTILIPKDLHQQAKKMGLKKNLKITIEEIEL